MIPAEAARGMVFARRSGEKLKRFSGADNADRAIGAQHSQVLITRYDQPCAGGKRASDNGIIVWVARDTGAQSPRFHQPGKHNVFGYESLYAFASGLHGASKLAPCQYVGELGDKRPACEEMKFFGFNQAEQLVRCAAPKQRGNYDVGINDCAQHAWAGAGPCAPRQSRPGFVARRAAARRLQPRAPRSEERPGQPLFGALPDEGARGSPLASAGQPRGRRVPGDLGV